MTFFLPTAQAGRVAIGSDVRIVLDAVPQYVIRPKPHLSPTSHNSRRRPSRPRRSVKSSSSASRRGSLRSCSRSTFCKSRPVFPAWPTSSSIRMPNGHPHSRANCCNERAAGTCSPGTRAGGPARKCRPVAWRDARARIRHLRHSRGAHGGPEGPDGAGKSSLLSLIAGAQAVQEGHVDVLDGDMADATHRRLTCPKIAYMPQGLGKNLYPTLSVFENVDFFGRLFGQDKLQRDRRIGELLRSTGLEPFTDRPAAKLSGGMKQKLGLCCALIHDPDLLILDEPTTGVDPLSRRQFWELIDTIRLEANRHECRRCHRLYGGG